MKRHNNGLVKMPSDDVFNTLYSWPFHLLDSVRASNIRNLANSVQYVVVQLVNGKRVETYTLSSAIDSIKEIISWIVTYENAEVTLKDMVAVKNELQDILATLENVWRTLALNEQDDLYGIPDEDEEELRS
jgi:hypothetical protein